MVTVGALVAMHDVVALCDHRTLALDAVVGVVDDGWSLGVAARARARRPMIAGSGDLSLLSPASLVWAWWAARPGRAAHGPCPASPRGPP